MNAHAAAHWPALLQLASSALPVGGFGYSQGLESAVELQQVRDEASAAVWIGDLLQFGFARADARWWRRAAQALQANEIDQFAQINAQCWASRETRELRLESEQTGRSLLKWLRALDKGTLDAATLDQLDALRPLTWPCAHAAACTALSLPAELGLHALGWSLLENQVLAAVKLVPLGQDAGQRVLHQLAQRLPDLVAEVLASDTEPNTFLPMLALHSSAHESQFSRLFRS